MTMKHIEGFKAPVAVVDWVAFVVELGNSSHGGYLKSEYTKFGVTHARPLNVGAGGAASIFEIRLQHPDSYSVIEDFLSELNARYRLLSEPRLKALEVSIDFYHRATDLTGLKSMTERLMLGITPPEIHNPRIVGDRFDVSGGVMPSRKAIDATKTLYIGNESDDLMWRVYFKRTDDVFIGENGKREPKPLPPSEYRARVEVRLQGNSLKWLMLDKVSDLEGFCYERLYSAGFFRFAKRNFASGPIFKTPLGILGARSLGLNDESPSCVLNGFGRKDSRHRERKLSRHLVTDKELTEASRHALRRLTGRF